MFASSVITVLPDFDSADDWLCIADDWLWMAEACPWITEDWDCTVEDSP
jgi:hypothetical protein